MVICDRYGFKMKVFLNAFVAGIMWILAEEITGQWLIHDRGSSYFIGIIFFYISIEYKKSEELGN